jgi:hypothetical protein
MLSCVFNPNLALITNCDRTPKWGVRLPRSYQGILDEARMRKHNTWVYNTVIFKLKVVITVWVPCIRFTKDEAKRVLQRIEQSFGKAIHLSRQAHTLHPRREWAPTDDLHLWVPVGNPALIGLDLPLTTLFSVARRRKNILTCTQIKTIRAKAWATTLNKTYPSRPKDHEF